MSLADRIAIMNDGVLQQVGTPSEVYLHPSNLFVAQFVGSPVMNVTKATIRPAAGSTKVAIGDGGGGFDFPTDLERRIAELPAADRDITVGVRPEAVLVTRQQSPGYLPAEAHIIEPLGAYDIVDLKIGGQLLRARTASGQVGKAGDMVWARLDEAQTHFFNAGSGESLNIRLGQ